MERMNAEQAEQDRIKNAAIFDKEMRKFQMQEQDTLEDQYNKRGPRKTKISLLDQMKGYLQNTGNAPTMIQKKRLPPKAQLANALLLGN